jgi:hypothetical protein
MFAHF